MICSVWPDLWVPRGGRRQREAESRCLLPTPPSAVTSRQPAPCRHGHTHAHAHTGGSPHTHAQTYLQTSPQVQQQNTRPCPHPICLLGHVQGIHPGPKHTGVHACTHTHTHTHTHPESLTWLPCRGHCQDPVRSSLPQGRPMDCSGDRGSLLHGTRGLEPALSPG